MNRYSICKNSLVKGFLCAALLIATSHIAVSQKFDVNTIHCSMTDENMALMTKIGKFEGHFYNVIFDTDMNDTVTVKINLYGRHGEYNKVQDADIHTTFIDGFYLGSTRQVYVYKSDDYVNVLLHESSHALMQRNLYNAPKWLNEGVATLFGKMVIGDKGDVYYVKQSRYIASLKKYIRENNFKLENFFRYDNNDWFVEDKREYLYTVSYCLIYYFAQNNIEDLQRFMLLLKQGNNTATAIKKIYGGIQQFQDRFVSFYVNEAAYNAG